MTQKYKHFKQLTLNYGIGNFQVFKIYNTLGLNKKSFPLKLKSSHIKALTILIKPMLTSKNLKNSIKEAVEFGQHINTFKSLKTKSKVFLKNKQKSINEKKKYKI